jgi:hypothetical protein
MEKLKRSKFSYKIWRQKLKSKHRTHPHKKLNGRSAFIVHQIIHELPVLMHICIVSKNLTSFVLNIHIL